MNYRFDRIGLVQRAAAWRRRGFLPLNLLRSRTLQIYEKLSNEALNPRLRQTDVGSSLFLFVSVIYYLKVNLMLLSLCSQS